MNEQNNKLYKLTIKYSKVNEHNEIEYFTVYYHVDIKCSSKAMLKGLEQLDKDPEVDYDIVRSIHTELVDRQIIIT